MTIFQAIRNGTIPACLMVDDVYRLTEAGILPEDASFELIDGEIVPMPAGTGDWHALALARLVRRLVVALPDPVRLYPKPSITLADDLLLEADLAVLPRGAMIRDIRGPDILLLIEVADSSISYDLRVKTPLYAAHGVREYWVVDAIRETIRVHREPADGTYRDVEEYDADVTIKPLLLAGVAIRLDALA